MKLVNVEDLKVLVAIENEGSISYGKLVTDLFNGIPTVDAIPIKWLKQWFERQVWQGSSPTDRIRCKASDIIEDWKKENAGS